ncbi:MAG: hypothetical protein IID32_04270 [Planctomycetes bacterium]|nr:hypothetical protein [Planctomycetota bacterium]
MRRRTIEKPKTENAWLSRFKSIPAFLKSPIVLLVIVMFLGIGFRVYKMHHTGIVADEHWTYRDFTKDIHTAVTNYKSTNNHVLNSVLIVLTRKVLGGYEHFIRIPALLFGILFCVAATCIVHSTIRSSVLKIVLLLLILMNWFIVDLTILARGYAIALGVTYAGIALLIKWSPETAEHKKINWLIVLSLIAMNYFAFGSMLSSLSILLAINAAFFALIIYKSAKRGRKTLKHAMIRVMTILLGSMILLHLLYHQVYAQVMRLGKSFKDEPFHEYLNKILWEPLIYIDASWIDFNKRVLAASLVLLVVCAVICLWAFFFRSKTGKYYSPSFTSPATRILLLTGAVLLFMFLQQAVFGMSLGMPRNGVFLLPLVLISSGILMDRTALALSRIPLIPVLLRFTSVTFLGILFLLNWPSPRAVNVRPYDWGKQSSIGPLTRMLHRIDPDKIWKVKLNPSLVALKRPLLYYEDFGYHAKRSKGEYDVLVTLEHSPDSRFVYLEYEYFKDHHCCMIINSSSFNNKPIFFQMHHKAATSPNPPTK